MSPNQSYFFVSYSRKDVEAVSWIVGRLAQEGINLWTDIASLEPGVNWEQAITDALKGASGLIIFLSAASLKSKFVSAELNYALRRGARVFTVLLENVDTQDIPLQLASIQYIDMRNKDDIEVSIARLTSALKNINDISAADTGLSSGEIQEVAKVTAEQARGEKSSSKSTAPPDSIFIVHGRDTQFLDDVAMYVTALSVKPIVLGKMSNVGHMSLLAKFLQYGQLAEFAVVLITSDDYGVLFDTYNAPGVGTQALQFRARQNVILELGFFYGHLGFDRVFVLFKPPRQPFPNFEFPSDIGAIPYDTYDATGNWRSELRMRLKTAGFAIP